MNQTTNNQVLAMYANPSSIQNLMILDLENRILGGKKMVDGNNVCSFLMESFSSITGNIVRGVTNEFESLYPKRAQSPEQLFKHMSNFDYIGLHSTPASTYMEIMLRKDRIVETAVPVNAHYSKVVIPRTTVFEIDQFKFSIYYPIEIRVNIQTSALSVSYDTSVKNPLYDLATNTLEHRTFHPDGLEMISILIPIHQFERTVSVDDSPSNMSFIKKYKYTDDFYAIRIYTNSIRSNPSKWVELEQTQSGVIYDPSVLTAQTTVDTESKQVKVVIPHTYVSNNRLGPRVMVEMLSTHGVMDADISNVDPNNVSVTFILSGDNETDKYSIGLNKPDVLIVKPASVKIVGGSSGIDFETLRQRVIHNTFHGSAIIGPNDVKHYFSDKGFVSSIYQDGITNRIYRVHKELTNSKGVIVPSAMVPVVFSSDSLLNISTIQSNYDNSYTIKPTTLYEYDRTTSKCIPLSNSEIAEINALTKANKVARYNSKIYTSSPYHLRLDVNHRYPLAYVYDLTAPKLYNMTFVGENINVITQLSVFNTRVTHVSPRVNGYDIDFEVIKSDDLNGVDPSDIKFVVFIPGSHSTIAYQECIYVENVSDNVDLYRVHLDTEYDLDIDHRMNIKSMSLLSGVYGKRVGLEDSLGLLFMVNKSFFPEGLNTATNIGSYIPTKYPDFVPLSEQRAILKLGELVTQTHNKLDIVFDAQEYLTYDETVYATYSSPVYERDSDNHIMYPLVKIHEVGDIIRYNQTVLLTEENIADYYESIIIGTDPAVTLDSSNASDYIDTMQQLAVPAVLHKEGEHILDATGAPVVKKNRKMTYVVDMIQVDNKFSLSKQPEHIKYLDTLAQQLRSYYSTVSSAVANLREEMWLYFHPLRTLGVANFKLDGHTTVDMDLELSIKLKLYVYQHVMENAEMLTSIRRSVIDILDDHMMKGVMSSTIIANEIIQSMNTMIKYVDVLGINDQGSLQTFVNINTDVKPNLKQVLSIADDGNVYVERALTLEFVPVAIDQ